MKSVSGKTPKKSLALNQPEYRHLIRKLRQLMQLTQVQLATELGGLQLNNTPINWGE